jgi:O-methyltransferase
MNSINSLILDLIDTRTTMVGLDCFNTVLTHYSNINSLEGDIVECGVWRGGFSIFLGHLFSDKSIWVCDSYEGFQPLETAKYKYDMERHTPEYTHNYMGPISISLEEVLNNFEEYGLSNQSRIKFLKGFVKDVLPESGIEKISLLRIDVDAYSATLEVLDELYDKVQPGGYIIFDDSCLYECIDAIKYFFKKNNIPEYIHHPTTGDKLYLKFKYTNDDSGFPSGCYIVKS